MGTPQILALILTFAVHVAGALLLAWTVVGDDGWESVRGWWPRDDRPDEDPPRAPEPRPSGPGRPLPLDETVPSRVRLREQGERLRDARPRP
ncbi:MAG: hypothetical protein M3P39_07715, partial [Actinomycetota bacterium]|nr:hypothetical protein [Actinomycetota bacterium]